MRPTRETTTQGAWHHLWCAVIATLPAFVCLPAVSGEVNPNWALWKGVSRVKGVATVWHRYVRDEADPRMIGEEIRAGTYTFSLPAAPPNVENSWMGDDANVEGEHHYWVKGDFGLGGGIGEIRVDSTYTRQLQSDGQAAAFFLGMRGPGTWAFKVIPDVKEPIREQYVGPGGAHIEEVNASQDGGSWLEGTLDKDTNDGGPGLLTLSQVEDSPAPEANPNNKGQIVRTVRLWPEYDDVVLEVRIPGYANWRPLGSIEDPKSSGSTLTVTAELKSKDPSVPLTVKPRSFQFQLVNTSREPGVCMNWPLGATDRDPDMRLRPYPGTHGGLNAEGQALMVDALAPDAASPNVAKAFLDSFDFGGRSELQVTATLDDGRTIVGALVDPGGNANIISLPKSNYPGGWIAQSWRRDHHVENLPDSDDSEGDPKGDGNPGDGYTLYEEYRGFVENGKHIEGDPQKKDFFILNTIGADASAGISLVQKLSGLKVHGKLGWTEMSMDSRLMNGNHRDAPHRVDQHGVWMTTAMNGESGDGGLTEYIANADQSKRLKPGTTRGIYIIGRKDPNSNFIHPFNNTSWGQSVAYTKTVAHELLHSVSVAHHGEGNRWEKLFFRPTGNDAKSGSCRQGWIPARWRTCS